MVAIWQLASNSKQSVGLLCRLQVTNGCVLFAAQQMNALIKYLNNVGDAKDGKHESIDGWIWWSWNANSGDTGGLVSPKPGGMGSYGEYEILECVRAGVLAVYMS
jgi:hypothetical protein